MRENWGIFIYARVCVYILRQITYMQLEEWNFLLYYLKKIRKNYYLGTHSSNRYVLALIYMGPKKNQRR